MTGPPEVPFVATSASISNSNPVGVPPDLTGQPPAPFAAAPGPSRRRNLALPLLCAGLALLLVGGGAFSYVTISNTNADLADTKSALATEQAAHKAASDHASALEKCVAALLADETTLGKLETQVATAQASELAANTAEDAYSAALDKAVRDFNQSWIDVDNATTTAQWNAAVAEANAAYREWLAAAALNAKMEVARAQAVDAASQVKTTQASLDTQLSQTRTVCASADVSSVPSASPAQSVSPSTH